MKAFCEKVKETAAFDEYLVLLECFHEYSNGRITTDVLRDLVRDLLGEYPGFFDEFLTVFKISDGLTPSRESEQIGDKRKNPGSDQGVGQIDGYNKKTRLSSFSVQEKNPESARRNNKAKDDHLDQAFGFCEKVMKKTSSEDYLALLKCLHDYGTGKITMVDVKITIADYFPDFMEDFDLVLEFYGSLTRSSSKSDGKIDNKGKKLLPDKEVDELTECYRFLPKDLSGVHSTGITKLGKEVLNFCCYSEGSFGGTKPRHRDPDEEDLNRREDKLFERYMLRAWMRSTKKNATKLSKAIKEGKIKKPTMEDVNSHFTSYNFRFIAKMYGEFGSLVVDQLHHSPETVLPVLISRLNQMELQM